MVFSDLVQQISEQIPVQIIHIEDTFEISDVMLLDGNQTDYRNFVLYIGYSEQLNFPPVPAHCVLVSGKEPGVWPETKGDLALVREGSLFALINAVKALLDASRGKGLYAELTDCVARRLHSTCSSSPSAAPCPFPAKRCPARRGCLPF